MRIISWLNYNPHEFRELIESVLNDVLYWHVAVVYGPTSDEDKLYMSSKPKSEWSVNDVMNGLWRLGVEAEWLDPTQPDFSKRVKEFDAAFINVHGDFGEDGNLQGLLAYLGVPYTGSGVSTSAIAADKRLTKLVLAQSGVLLPYSQRVLSSHLNNLPNIEVPIMLKAVNGGSSIGMELIIDSSDFDKAIKRLNQAGFYDLIAESFIEGIPVTVPAMRIKDEIILLPPVACITDRKYYDEFSKLQGDQNSLVQYQTFTDPTDIRLHRLHDAVRKILEILDFDGILRADFIVDHNGKPTLLELNTIPGVQHGSNLVLSAEAAGINYPSLLGVILASAANIKKLTTWTRKDLVK